MVTTPEERTRPIRIDEEMRTSYINYAMSVIVSRALPDVRDGLKPVQRRILYAMHDISLGPNSAHKKCARIVGEVLGKYHPHGDGPVYDALVRMAQDFSLRYPLVDGQGNFGSVDDDPPAAMRYTEARLTRIAQELLADIQLDTVDFATNFDDSLKEPVVLPGRLPNLLVNGASGIAVGMATSIPPHNLGEICDAISRLIDHPDTYVEDLLKIVKGPDFPTKAMALVGRDGEFVRQLYTTGHGRVVMRARAQIDELKGSRYQIIVTELPYQVNKASLVARIAQMARDKKIEGISDIRDESDRKGMRMVIELRRDAQAEMVLNNLYKHTAMQSSFNSTMLALVDGQPQILNLKRILQLFIEHRQVVITRRSEYLLRRAKERAHILEGLRKAIEFLDLVIQLIRAAKDAETARNSLMERLELTEIQAQAILDMQLRRLAALERQRLEEEYQQVVKTIGELEALLADPTKVLAVIKDETRQLKKDYSGPRLTQIVEEGPTQHTLEDLTQHQEVVITISRRGYIKRMPSATYRSQLRGGKGIRGMTTREDDAVRHLLVADTHDMLLFFTNRGRVYRLRGFEIYGETSRTTRGTPMVNLINLAPGERVNEVVATPELDMEGQFVLGTRKGEVKGLRLRDLANLRSNGLIIMDLESGDELVSVRELKKDEDVVFVTANGQSIRFPASNVPLRSRPAGGVRGIKLVGDDEVVGMETVTPQDKMLVISAQGHGKLVSMARYPKQRRGGMGVRAFNVTKKTGPLAHARVVTEGVEDEVLLVSEQCKVYRTNLEGISTQGRHASGVIIWRPGGDDQVASIACFQNNHEA
jgi:DNA gyrase subunit A